MDNYELKEDEVVLYKGNVTILGEQEKTQLLFTNLNIVFISKVKNIFSGDEKFFVDVFPTQDVKFYNNAPQIKVENSTVELYLKSGEKFFNFDKKSELHKFENTVLNFFSGKTTAERNAQKIKSGIGLVNDTLNIDVVKMVGSSIKNLGKGLGSTLGEGLKVFKKNKKE